MEHRTVNPTVVGSNPTGGAFFPLPIRIRSAPVRSRSGQVFRYAQNLCQPWSIRRTPGAGYVVSGPGFGRQSKSRRYEAFQDGEDGAKGAQLVAIAKKLCQERSSFVGVAPVTIPRSQGVHEDPTGEEALSLQVEAARGAFGVGEETGVHSKPPGPAAAHENAGTGQGSKEDWSHGPACAATGHRAAPRESETISGGVDHFPGR